MASGLDDGQQRIVGRSVAFFVVPTLLLVALLLVLAWEILRANAAPQSSTAAPVPVPSPAGTPSTAEPRWPWRLTLLGVAPAATLCGAIGALLFARGQYARTTRPRLGWAGRSDAENKLLAVNAAYLVTMYNGGSGHAVLQRLEFRATSRPDPDAVRPGPAAASGAASPGEAEWLGQPVARQLLAALSLKPGVDFAIQQLDEGTPLPAVKAWTEGIEIAAFGQRALEALTGFAMRARFTDSVGDTYERTIVVLGD
jgi:hypothetical protein